MKVSGKFELVGEDIRVTLNPLKPSFFFTQFIFVSITIRIRTLMISTVIHGKSNRYRKNFQSQEKSSLLLLLLQMSNKSLKL